MLTLTLLRHAKSSWSDTELDDYDRPLAKRGAKAAPLIAKYMRREELRPDIVLCSGAVRTRATLALVIAALGPPAPEVRYEEKLYLASPATILARVRDIAPAKKHVLVLGHNPGIHSLALELVGTGDRRLLEGLAQEFPTAALASLTFPITSWSEIKTASGKLEHFVTPRRLDVE